MSSGELEYPERLATLRQSLQATGVEALWLPPSSDVTYLLGIPTPRPPWGLRDPITLHPTEGVYFGSAGPIAVTSDSVWGRSARAALEGKTYAAVRNESELSEIIAGSVLSLPPYGTLEQRAILTQNGAVVSHELCDKVAALRRIKSALELRQMRRAQGICMNALTAAVAATRIGASVIDFRTELINAMFRLGAEAVCSGPEIQLKGPTVNLPFGVTSPTELAAAVIEGGSVMTLNFGCMVGGYLSDMGRTVFAGKPTRQALFALEVARAAQAAGAEVLGRGGSGAAIVWAVREVLDRQGVRDGIWPKAGHGIGIEHHEAPLNDSQSDQAYLPGMTATVEVGFWPAQGTAAYCEDVVVCRSNAVEWLSRPGEVHVIR